MVRETVLEVASGMPETATLEEIIEAVYIQLQIEQGLEAVKNGNVFSSEEVWEEIKNWKGKDIMKENLLAYPAIFTEEDGEYWVKFIDLKGCYSEGKTLADTMENAKEAMGLFLEDLDEYPKCTTNIKDIKLEKNQIISFISIKLKE